jgi:hypothetical protein
VLDVAKHEVAEPSNELRYLARDRLRQVIKSYPIPIPAILDDLFREGEKGRAYTEKILRGVHPLHSPPNSDIEQISLAIAKRMPGKQPTAEKQKQVFDFAVHAIVPPGVKWNEIVLTEDLRETPTAIGLVALSGKTTRTTSVGLTLPDDIRSIDAQTREILEIAKNTSPFLTGVAIDGCFELSASENYRGWMSDQINFRVHDTPTRVPEDLAEICRKNVPDGPNNPKYQLVDWAPGSTERGLTLDVAPTTYYRITPILRNLRVPILSAMGAQTSAKTPLERYQHTILQFDNCPLPSHLYCAIIITLKGEKLLITQRVKHRSLDVERGKWSCSIEENMSGPPDPDTSQDKRIDRNFFDTVRAGIYEELLSESAEIADSQIKIISMIIEGDNLAVGAIALVNLDLDLAELLAKIAALRSIDTQAEIRDLSEIDWTIEAIAPILYRKEIEVIGSRIGPDAWHRTSRMRMLAALYYKYSEQEVNARLRLLRDGNEKILALDGGA